MTSILLRGDGEYGSQQNANESEQKEEVLQLPDGQEIVVTAQVVAVKAVFIPWSGSDHQDKVPFNSFQSNLRVNYLAGRPTSVDADRSIENIAKFLEGMGATLKSALNMLGKALPDQEEEKLHKLANGLQYVGRSMKAGTIDTDTARAMTKDAFELFLDEAGGIGVAFALTTFTRYVSNITPLPPKVEWALIGMSPLIGFVLEGLLDKADEGLQIKDSLATGFTNGIFNSIASLTNVLDMISDKIEDALTPSLPDDFFGMDLSSYEASSDPYDINGVDPAFYQEAFYDGMPVVEQATSISFYGGDSGGDDGEGPKFEYDEPIGARIEPLSSNEQLMLMQDIQIA